MAGDALAVPSDHRQTGLSSDGPEPGVFKSRRRDEFIVREGRLVGVQLSELDAVVRPDGGTQPGFPLPIGTVFFLVEDLYSPDPTSPTNPGPGPVGTGRTTCTVQPPQGLVISCDVALDLDDEGTLYGIETIDFTAQTPGEPLAADLAILGGTGTLTGATGQCALVDREDHDLSGVSFYDCRLVQPAVAAHR